MGHNYLQISNQILKAILVHGRRTFKGPKRVDGADVNPETGHAAPSPDNNKFDKLDQICAER